MRKLNNQEFYHLLKENFKAWTLLTKESNICWHRYLGFHQNPPLSCITIEFKFGYICPVRDISQTSVQLGQVMFLPMKCEWKWFVLKKRNALLKRKLLPCNVSPSISSSCGLKPRYSCHVSSTKSLNALLLKRVISRELVSILDVILDLLIENLHFNKFPSDSR